MSDEVKAAMIAAVFGILAAIITTVVEQRRYKKQLEADAQREGERLRADAERQAVQLRADAVSQAQQLQEAFRLQEERLRAELRTEFMAESAIQQLLSEAQKQRSFEAIDRRIGGFEEDELRKLLVRSGPVRFYRQESDRTKTELWGLRTRNIEAANRDDDPVVP